LLAGVEGVCRKDSDEAVSGRASQLRSGVVAPLRGVRDGCELDLSCVAFPGFFSVMLDVDEVLTWFADVVVLPDVGVTLAGSVSVLLATLLPLLEVGVGTSMSCTSTSVLALDLTALMPFTEAGLVSESTDVLPKDGDRATFSCRPEAGLTDLAASFVRLTVGLFAFFSPADGTSISCMVDGVRDLARLLVLSGDVGNVSVMLTDVSLPSLFSVVVVGRSEDDEDDNDVSLTLASGVSAVSSVASTLLRAATETTASAAAAAAA